MAIILDYLNFFAKFDPFLDNHRKEFGNNESDVTSYLSKTICQELIHMVGYEVWESVLNDLKTAGISLSVDSTPHPPYVHLLIGNVSYVWLDDGLPIEYFLTFLKMIAT